MGAGDTVTNDDVERLDDAAERDRVAETLERLLAIRASTVRDALTQAAHLLAEALGCDKLDAFLYEQESDSLVALGTSDTPMGRREHALGLDRMPIANGGHTVMVFQSGTPFHTGHADLDPIVLPGFTRGLGVRSMLVVPLEADGERRGVLGADSARPDAFTRTDLRFLQAVSHWVGQVAHRAQLAEQVSQEVAAQQRLGELDRLRSDFIAMVSHNLQTPLTAVRAGLSLLDASAQDRLTDEERAVLAAARQSAERLRLQVDDLLTANQIEAGALRLDRAPLDLRDPIMEAVAQLQPALHARSQELRLDLPAALPVMGDAPRLTQVVTNLLDNARRHTPEGTPVTVSGWAAAEAVHLVVRDSGPGIPSQELEAVFARFHRGEQAAGGSGLGLAIVRAVVERHEGRVWAERPEGGGTAMHVVLQCHEAEGEDV